VSRRAALLAGAGTALAASLPSRAFGHRGNAGGSKLADLTHTYSEEFPLFPGVPPISRTTLFTVQDNGLYGQQWTLFEHACTHMDAPAHFAVDGRTIEQLGLSELVAPVVVIDIAERAATDPDTVVTPADLRAFERRHGRIPRGAVVCMHSGWEERAGDVEAYLNADADGVLHFPGFGKPAAEWLLAERDIRGIGVDTLSLDHGSSTTFDVHVTVLPADRYGIENLRGLAAIPARGATIYLGVIPWRDGSGGPCRAFAAW
jgi:kynurenine formamidase